MTTFYKIKAIASALAALSAFFAVTWVVSALLMALFIKTVRFFL